MAAAAPSPLASSVEKTNGAKLSRLLIDGGTTVLRNVFDHHHPPASLAAHLNAKYSILSKLSRRRALNGHQWDKLFPPGGTAPDSKTFDITLLFLLLTNVCALSPPPSGWHTKPPPSDTSLEANLARIKFFRNGLYGHVASTGVDTPTFSSLWVEISTVLVSLGLDQAEIVRLKAEHGGEEDYVDALLEWADSEEVIKSQLKEIRQSQSQIEEKITNVHQSQLKLHETLQKNTSKWDEVSQTQSKTEDALEEVMNAQLKCHQLLQDNKVTLDEVNQKVKVTHQAFEEAHKESVSWLQGVDESQTKTHQVVAEVRDSIQEVKQEMENLKKRRETERAEELLKSLVKSEFRGDIDYHAQKFQEGTREWIFKSVQNWLDDRTSLNRVMVISGNAGMGKTVISAVVAQRMQETGRLSGSHFCQHNNARYRNPRLMLQSLACHLSHALPDYKHRLVEQLSRNLGKDLNNMGVEELFALLFKEPLSTVADPGRNILIVIDGLDEIEYRGRNELLDVIRNHFSKLPVWIRTLITTRPERNITAALQHLKPTQLEQNHEENLNDIEILFQSQLSQKIGEEHKDILLKELVKKSEGLFIYAYFLIDFIQKNVLLLTPDQLESILPLGISSIYLSYFKRLENDFCNELKAEEEQVLRFLCALTASREPLPIEFASRILNPGGRSLTAQRRFNKAIACISTLLPVRDGRLHFFHKSVKDWLTDQSCYGQHDFNVDEKEGHDVLFSLCTSELDNIKRKGVDNTQFSNTERYALQHGVQHMLEMDVKSRPHDLSEGELFNKYVTDLELIYAKLVVSCTSCLEEFFNVKKYVKALMSDESHVAFDSLLWLLRKHSYALRETPHLFFQCLLNDGDPELSSKAEAILETELPNILYMKYMDKEGNKGAVQERFYCSDTVVCFDVSPQMDHMVCECRDGTIHLWSLKTGAKEWVRPSLVKKNFDMLFYPSGSAYRMVDGCLSCYRSVVFHPSGNFVLPGSLRDVYSFSGDSKCLFANCTCSFSDCTFSGDKKRLLTNSPDNSKEIVLWNTGNGHELNRIMWNDDVSGFAISQDGTLIAFSDFAGAVCLVDALNGAKSKVLIKNAGAVCGLMHFTSDNRVLFCGFLCSFMGDDFCYHFNNKAKCLNIYLTNPEEQETQLFDIFLWPSLSSDTTQSEFHMQRQPSCWFKNIRNAIPHLSVGFYLMIHDSRALISSPTLRFVSLVNVGLLHEEQEVQEDVIPFKEIMFSHKEDIIYFIGSTAAFQFKTPVASFRMSTQELIKCTTVTRGSVTMSFGRRFETVPFIPTKEGVVLFTDDGIPELWNFELTEFVRPFTELKNIMRLSPVSGELVAYHCCLPFESPVTVHIMNITSGNLVSSVKTTAPCDLFTIRSITCNGKRQVLISTCKEKVVNSFDMVNITLTLWNNDSCISWKRHSGWFPDYNTKDDLMFSPQDEFVVTWNCLGGGKGVHVLDAKTGETLHRFLQQFSDREIVDCKFVADCESLVCCSEDSFLRLYNVKSGDLLSVLDIEEQPTCLGTCPNKPLIIVGLPGIKHKVIHVELPRLKDAKEQKGSYG